ncbi:uncharacterized protein CBL_13794 [Carabus blaptoides fortunei]
MFVSNLCCTVSEDIARIVDSSEAQSRGRQNDKFANPFGSDPDNKVTGTYPESGNTPRCSLRLETALEQIRRRQIAKQKTLNLKGYSLHKQLRSIPYDMYVTDMKVRLPPSSSWVRVERCHFNPRNTTLETKLLFNDLTISGSVNLYRDSELGRSPYKPEPVDTCNMILRLRKAGIGFYTEPIRRERGQFNVRTDSHFLEPGFISVYAYGCEPKLKEHRRSGATAEDTDEDISQEMEDIFLKGIRTLLTTYMQKELQPAIKETLMKNMGYTISYGR